MPKDKDLKSTSTVATLVAKVNVASLPKPVNATNTVVIPFNPINTTSYAFQKNQDNLVQPKKSFAVVSPIVGEAGANISTPLKIFSGFEGLDQNGHIPPDVQIGVGPSHVVEMVNAEGMIWTKQGILLTSFSLTSFFSTTDDIFDSRIFYDALSGKWFASTVDATSHSVRLAVSTTSDPTGSWNIYNVSFGTNCPDQAKIAVSNDKFVVAANDFAAGRCNNTPKGGQFIVLDKNELITGPPITKIYDSGPSFNMFALLPVQSLSSTSTLFMVENRSNMIRLYTISGAVPNVSIATTDLAILASVVPPDAAQAGSSLLVNTGDNRVQDADWYLGKLWLSLNDACTPSGDSQLRSCIRLIQINTVSKTVTQDFNVGRIGYYYFYPALSIDSSGNLDLVFGFSSASDSRYPSIAVTGQTINDPINSVQSLLTLREGSYPNLDFRHGDYFGAALDPTDTGRAWVAGEYYAANSFSSSHWSTFIGVISSNVCVVPTSGEWIISASCTLTSSASAPGNVTVQNGAVLTIPSGVFLDINFITNHLFVQSGSGVLIQSGGKIF